MREICGLRDPDGSGEGQFVVEDGGRRAFAWMGFRLGHNGKGSNGFLEASSSSALKCMNTYGSIDQPDTKHSYPPNHENHENHTKQTASQPCFPLNKPHYSPSKNLHHHHHPPSPPFLHINHPLQQPIHADLARTQKRSQTKHFPILYLKPLQPPPGIAITKTLSLPPPPHLHPQVFPTPPTASSKTTAAQIIRLHFLDAAFIGPSTCLV